MKKTKFLNFLAGEPTSPAPCPHVAQGCGGCLLQEYTYAQQLGAKARALSLLYARPISITPAPQAYGYRNRMDFVFAFGKLGLRRRGSYAQVVDIQDCLLLPPHARQALTATRKLLLELQIESYNYIRHTGLLRYVVFRTSQTTKELQIIITTKTPKNEEEQTLVHKLIDRVHESCAATSTHWTTHDALGDASVGTLREFRGNSNITDEIAGLQFSVAPHTFFQANTELAGKLFSRAAPFAHGRVLDLCCGVGVFGIICARNEAVQQIVGIDIISDSITAAKKNAKRNNVSDRTSFIAKDMLEYLRTCQDSFDTVLCDPARPGLGKEVCDELLRLAPSTIIYVSCNAASHIEDIAKLNNAYRLELLEAYDLFPQTPHIEILSVLHRRS